MTTLILGSKPNPKIPQLNYDSIIFVNFSIAQKNTIPKAKKYYHVMSNYTLTTDHCRYLYLLKNTKVDILYLIRATKLKFNLLNKLSHINYIFYEKKSINRQERHLLTRKILGWQFPLRVLIKYKPKRTKILKILKELKRYFCGKEMSLAKPSTGIFSLILALSQDIGPPPYILSGIGITPSGHNFDSQKKYNTPRHLISDKVALDLIGKTNFYKDNVYTTEYEISNATSLNHWSSRSH